MKLTEEDEKSEFLRDIYGDDIPDDIEKEVLTCGSVVYSVGKPDFKKIIKMTLALMS